MSDLPARSRVWTTVVLQLLAAMLSGLSSASVLAQHCNKAIPLSLSRSVNLSPAERDFIAGLPALNISGIGNGPPLAEFDPGTRLFSGIGIDVFCFIAAQLELAYQWQPLPEKSLEEKIALLQDGELDLLMSLSHQSDREQRGIFTAPYFQTHYILLGRKGHAFDLQFIHDIGKYRVGIYRGSAGASELRPFIPADKIRYFHTSDPASTLYEALRSGDIDILIQNKSFFTEHRYKYELFDLDVIQVLLQYPRNYGFYLSKSEDHERLATLFDRYLAALDISKSLEAHAVGEGRLIQSYLDYKLQRQWLLGASLFSVVLLSLMFQARRKQQQLHRQLEANTTHILEQKRQLEEANQKLQQLSQADSLTGLANRRFFMQSLTSEYQRHQRSGLPLSLLMLDLDYFKNINDLYGHARGDEYLILVAEVLKHHCKRSGDLAARYGGEEFICLLPNTSSQQAMQVAESIRLAISAMQLDNAGSNYGRLTISIGIATSTTPPIEPGKLLLIADRYLYQAKHRGRNRVCGAKPTTA